MKTIRETDILGAKARLVETKDGYSAILIKNGHVVTRADSDNPETAWAMILSGAQKPAARPKSNAKDNPNLDNETYREVFNLIEDNNNHIYLTGRAGTGKTTFLRQFLEKTELRAVVVAPTGIAALNAGGQTAHSLFKFPPNLIRPQDIRRTKEGRLLRSIDLMVIDEVSMVRADLMDGIDRSLRLHRGIAKPFGGVRLLCVGDSAQLPPVVNRDDEAILDEWFGGPYFFDAPSARESNWTIIELCHSYRQTETHFLDILNRIRVGDIRNEDGQLLNTRISEEPPPASDGSVILTTTNEAARRINEKEMAALQTPSKIYQCDVDGQFDEKLFPTEGDLEIKIGAKVMMLRNDIDKRWVNGTLGTVHDILKDTIKVKIGKYIHEVEPVSWERFRYDLDENGEPKRSTVGTFTQLPIRPAWALTIHKAQGLTFDKVHIDFGRGTFAHGHTYVALSRCRSLNGLTISRGLRRSDLKIENGAFELYNKAKLQDFGEFKAGVANFIEE